MRSVVYADFKAGPGIGAGFPLPGWREEAADLAMAPSPQGRSLTIIPGRFVKNADDQVVTLNRIARSMIEARRGKHPTHVFAYQDKPVTRMLNSAWKRARTKAGRCRSGA